jgi:hypothetical protein
MVRRTAILNVGRRWSSATGWSEQAVKREERETHSFLRFAARSFFILLAMFHSPWLASAQPSISTTAQRAARSSLQGTATETASMLLKSSQRLRTDVELALANVVVTDGYNRLIAGLDADSFRIFQDNDCRFPQVR